MTETPHRVLLVSDANLANLAALLRNDQEEPGLEVSEAPYGAVLPTLLDPASAAWSERPDLTVVWTRPEGVLGSYADVLTGERVTVTDVERDVDAFADTLLQAASRSRWMAVPVWVPPFGRRGLGVVDLHDPSGSRALLARANHRLIERLRESQNVWALDASAWMERAGDTRTDRRLWYAAKVPFPTPVFAAAVRDLKSLLRAATGRSRKVVLLDLDNTLWGGVVGETGWEGLRLGGHDPVGEAFVDLQRALKALTKRGVVLGIVSKNEESVALEAIRKHPDMVLREEDFAGWRINWRDKATNVAELLDEIRLGLDSAVFIDDQPAERARVAEALPKVLVPDWPADPLASVQALDRLGCFDMLQVSSEDVARAQSYAAERERRALRESVSSMEDWLAELDVSVRVEAISTENQARAAQLLNKTNQMNLTTRRMSESELVDWAAGQGREFLTFRVSDRFSDFGLTGLLGLELEDDVMRIVDFVLSCRVMSRQVEEAMAHVAVEAAREAGAKRLEATHRPTERNAPMLAFWRDRSGFVEQGDGTFHWDPAQTYPAPSELRLSGLSHAAD